MTISFTLSDGVNTPVPYSFTVSYVNNPPVLVSPLSTQNVIVNSSVMYDMSTHFNDPEGASLSILLAASTPNFVTIVGLVINISPSYSIAASTFTVSLIVSDGVNLMGGYSFTVNCINNPPLMLSPIIAQIATVNS